MSSCCGPGGCRCPDCHSSGVPYAIPTLCRNAFHVEHGYDPDDTAMGTW